MIQTSLLLGREHCCQRSATATMDNNDPSPNAGKTYRNNGGDNSNFAMPCTELAHPTRTVRLAFTPPGTPAKRGKLATAVAGRVLPSRKLQHSGHSEGDSFVADQFLVHRASPQAESFKPNHPFVARKSFVHCNSVIGARVLQFNSAPFKAADQQAGHHCQRKLLRGTPITHAYQSTRTVNLGSQVGKQPVPQTVLQIWRTSSCSYHKTESTTPKGATITKMDIKQGSAFNKTSTKSVTHIRAARKQGSSTIKEGTAIKNIVESGRTSNTETMAHNPCLASNTPSRGANKHVVVP